MENSLCCTTELLDEFENADEDYQYTNEEEIVDASSDEDEGDINDFSVRFEDAAEVNMIGSFITQTCQCTLGPTHDACSKLFNYEIFSTNRMNCAEMEKGELDLVILANLNAHRCGESHQSRCHVNYYFHGKKVCKTTYLFLHGIGPKRFKNLLSHFDQNGLVSRTHGNTKRSPANTLPFSTTQEVVKFINNFALLHALPLPGRLPGQFSDQKALLLPSHMSKRFVYRQYKLGCEITADIPISRRKFESLWLELLPHIVSMKPATDLCAVCQSNVVSIMRSANLDECEKSEHLRSAEEHLRLARVERLLYNDECKLSIEEFKNNSIPRVIHLSFDFAQQIHFPSSPPASWAIVFLDTTKVPTVWCMFRS